MDFIKKLLQTNQERGRASIQITVENDFNLPDYEPDMIKLIDRKGSTRIQETRVEPDQVVVNGALLFQALYKCTESGNICSLQGDVPFTETIHMEGVQETDQLILQSSMDDLALGMINSRKLNVRALIELHVADQMEQQIELPTGIENNSVQALYQQQKMLQLLTQKKDICRIHSEILLPSNRPNISKLLWQCVQLRGLDSRIRSGEIELSGELLVNILYRSEEDEKQIQCMETTVALHERISCSECDPETIFKLVPVQVQLEVTPTADEDGENRVLMLEGTLDFYLRVWREENLQILEDAYSLMDELVLERESVNLQSLLVKNDSKFKVADQLQIENQPAEILQLCASVGEIFIEDSRIVPDGIETEGILKVRMLYITASDDMPIGIAEGVVPFSRQIEAEGIHPDDTFELSAGIDQLTVILADNSQADIKAVIGLDAIVFRRQDSSLITGIAQQPVDLEQYEKQPGIAGYIVKSGDRLWDIAKEHHTTVADVMQMNQLSSEHVSRGDKLLIVKQMGVPAGS